MYSYEDRTRAVKLYIKLGKRTRATIGQLGYPTKNTPNTLDHSVNVRLVVIIKLVCPYSLDGRWNNKAPPAWLNGRYVQPPLGRCY